MFTRDGEQIFLLPSRLHVVRASQGALELRGFGDDFDAIQDDEVREVSLRDLVEARDITTAEAKTLIAAILDTCENRVRKELAVPANRRMRIDVRLPEDWVSAKRLFDEAWLQRAEHAMKHRIANHTTFHVSTG